MTNLEREIQALRSSRLWLSFVRLKAQLDYAKTSVSGAALAFGWEESGLTELPKTKEELESLLSNAFEYGRHYEREIDPREKSGLKQVRAPFRKGDAVLVFVAIGIGEFGWERAIYEFPTPQGLHSVYLECGGDRHAVADPEIKARPR